MLIKEKFTGRVLLFALLFQAISLLMFTAAPIAQAAGAREYETPPCYDITGSSTPLNVDSVPNGGAMNFDDAGVSPAYQACVRMNAGGTAPDHLEGWVWDDNLGWVSLYCPGGAGATNLDIACGSIAYKVSFTTTGTGPDVTSVKLSGYAWGDNVGYISFNSAYHQLAPIASGGSKGLVDTSMGVAAYHVYADAVGWLDMRGVHMYWYDTDPPMTDQGVLGYTSICSGKDLITYTPPAAPATADSYAALGNDLRDMVKGASALFLANRGGATSRISKYTLPGVTAAGGY